MGPEKENMSLVLREGLPVIIQGSSEWIPRPAQRETFLVHVVWIPEDRTQSSEMLVSNHHTIWHDNPENNFKPVHKLLKNFV
jgi:hypothetical protein